MINLAKIYTYDIALTRPVLEEIIREKGRERDFYVRFSKRYVIIRLPYLVFNIMPVTFQVSFIARLIESKNKTTVKGKFDGPVLFYQAHAFAYVLFSGIFLLLSYADHNTVLNLLPVVLFIGIADLVFTKIYIGISRICFSKQNKMVLDLLDSIFKDYLHKDDPSHVE